MRASMLFKLANTLHNFCLGLLTFGSVSLPLWLIPTWIFGRAGILSSGRLALSTPSEEYPFLLYFSGCHFLPRGFGVSLTRTVIVLHPVLKESFSASYLRIQFRKRKGGGKRDFFLDCWGNRRMCDYPHNGIIRIRLPPRLMYGCNLLWQRQALPSAGLSFPLGLSCISYFGWAYPGHRPLQSAWFAFDYSEQWVGGAVDKYRRPGSIRGSPMGLGRHDHNKPRGW